MSTLPSPYVGFHAEARFPQLKSPRFLQNLTTTILLFGKDLGFNRSSNPNQLKPPSPATHTQQPTPVLLIFCTLAIPFANALLLHAIELLMTLNVTGRDLAPIIMLMTQTALTQQAIVRTPSLRTPRTMTATLPQPLLQMLPQTLPSCSNLRHS